MINFIDSTKKFVFDRLEFFSIFQNAKNSLLPAQLKTESANHAAHWRGC